MKLRCRFRNSLKKLFDSPSCQDPSEELKAWKEDWKARGPVWLICFALFFIPLVLYQILGQDELLDRPVAFDVGIVTVSAAFGSLLLNAGMSTNAPKRKETIRVAKKFIYVVILTVFSLPVMHFVELINVDISSFEPDSPKAWLRGFYLWFAVISFYLAIILFIIALVDLVCVLIGIGNTEHGCKKTDATSCRKDSCNAG